MPDQLMEGTWVRWIPALPLLAALIHGVSIGLLRRPFTERTVVGVSSVAVGGSLLFTGLAFAELIGQPGPAPIEDRVATWIGLGVGSASFNADFAFRFDALSAVMCLVVTGVGLLIQIYAIPYMRADERDDRGFQRFFCFVNLFIGSMLVLVLADNIVLMFLGWEGVGVCSYLLIGFWYAGDANARAGSKAFVVNRIGDLGFLVGILLLYWSLSEAGTPTVTFKGIESAMPVIAKQSFHWPAWLGGGEIGLASVIGLCLFIGACGKSAQLPLFVWLPDAMAGPTPVSALIHAATMVTAGVYMLARLSFLYAAAPEASWVVAWTGCLTAFFAALVACAQTDIKRLLAYSTISQLGYMFLAAGVGAHTASMFHVVTHAFFKALLFMTAGVVILALKHEQDMRRMGGIGGRMPVTRIYMWFGVATLAGAPPSAGFFSKDQILVATYAAQTTPGNEALYWIALVTVAFTALYATRMIYMSLYGESRVSPPELRREIVEPENGMLWPMGILAALCGLGTLVGLPQIWGEFVMPDIEESNSIHHFLEGVVTLAEHPIDHATEWDLTGRAIAMSALGAGLGVLLYLYQPGWPAWVARRLGALHQLLVNGFYVDALYRTLIVRPLVFVSDHLFFRIVDAKLIDEGAVLGSARVLRGLADRVLKYGQSGLTQAYFLVMLIGGMAIVAWLVFGGEA